MRRSYGAALLIAGWLLAGCAGPESPSVRSPITDETATSAAGSPSPSESAVPPILSGSVPPHSGGAPAPGPTSAKKPVSPKTTVKKNPPPATSKPPAKGSPLDILPIEIVGSSYAQTGPAVEGQLIRACGGTLCVKIDDDTVEGPPDPYQDCSVKRIIQPKPIYRGDTITFVLSDPCGGFGEPSTGG